jgi:hypothetical protein
MTAGVASAGGTAAGGPKMVVAVSTGGFVDMMRM